MWCCSAAHERSFVATWLVSADRSCAQLGSAIAEEQWYLPIEARIDRIKLPFGVCADKLVYRSDATSRTYARVLTRRRSGWIRLGGCISASSHCHSADCDFADDGLIPRAAQ
jgi:hypothetical protein